MRDGARRGRARRCGCYERGPGSRTPPSQPRAWLRLHWCSVNAAAMRQRTTWSTYSSRHTTITAPMTRPGTRSRLEPWSRGRPDPRCTGLAIVLVQRAPIAGTMQTSSSTVDGGARSPRRRGCDDRAHYGNDVPTPSVPASIQARSPLVETRVRELPPIDRGSTSLGPTDDDAVSLARQRTLPALGFSARAPRRAPTRAAR